MESLLDFICLHAAYAHFIFFGLLMLAGLNVPISEDVVLLTGGAIASLCIPDHALRLFIWIFLGCWISAWEAYWIGRLLGPKLYKISWFSRFLTAEKIERLHSYYERFGIFTFIVGRFIPGGVRNALFITTGLGKMPFPKFIVRDGIACFLSNSILFSTGYAFAKHYWTIISYFKTYNLIFIILILFAFSVLGIIIYFRRKKAIHL